jgi:hypothetical protein
LSYLKKVSGKGFQSKYVGVYKVPAIQQEKNAECGCCCVGLVLRLLQHNHADDITPEMLRAESQKYPGGYRPSPMDVIQAEHIPEGLGTAMGLLKASLEEARSNVSEDEAASLAWPTRREPSLQYLGSTLMNMEKLLKLSYGYKDTVLHKGPSIMTVLGLTSIARPLIVAVAFPNVGRHFVVACGHQRVHQQPRRPKRFPTDDPRVEEYLFSDPAHGIGWLRLDKDEVYEPQPGVKGRLTDEFISPTW